jgi:hypothetical protein
MKAAAFKLAERGLAVFPLKARDKIPATRHGCKDATKDLEVIAAWWDGWPQANIGIATGSKSGIWVLDIDGEEGEASLRDIEKRMQRLPATVEAITGGGGRHLFFRLPDFDDAPVIKNSAGQLGTGLDVRGEGGYVVAPPSIHPSGRFYTWSVDSASEFADPPVITLPPDNVTGLDERRPAEHWRKVAREGAAEGTRNATAASLTGYLLRHGIDAHFALDMVLAWNASPQSATSTRRRDRPRRQINRSA